MTLKAPRMHNNSNNGICNNKEEENSDEKPELDRMLWDLHFVILHAISRSTSLAEDLAEAHSLFGKMFVFEMDRN